MCDIIIYLTIYLYKLLHNTMGLYYKMATELTEIISKNRRSNVNKLISKKYKSINDFCVQNGEDYSAVHRYLNGTLRIGNIVIKRFEKIFGLKSGDLDKSSELNEIVQIPIFSSKGAFISIDNLLLREPSAYAHIEGFIFNEFGVSKADSIGITYDNDSMSPDIKIGWSILIDLSETDVQDGETYAILLHNKIQFRKIFFLDATTLVLKPINADFAEATIMIKDLIVIGKPAYILGGSYNK